MKYNWFAKNYQKDLIYITRLRLFENLKLTRSNHQRFFLTTKQIWGLYYNKMI